MSLTIAALLARYGLPIIYLGAGIEGEMTVIGAGMLAHEGVLEPWAVALAAGAGSFTADQCLFALGRRAGRHPRLAMWLARPPAQRVLGVLQRHPDAFIFGFRFINGVRTVSPVVIGASLIPRGRFMLVNLLAGAVWGAAFTAIGYFFGTGLDRLLGHVPTYAKAAALLPLVGLLLVVVRVARSRLRC